MHWRVAERQTAEGREEKGRDAQTQIGANHNRTLRDRTNDEWKPCELGKLTTETRAEGQAIDIIAGEKINKSINLESRYLNLIISER